MIIKTIITAAEENSLSSKSSKFISGYKTSTKVKQQTLIKLRGCQRVCCCCCKYRLAHAKKVLAFSYFNINAVVELQRPTLTRKGISVFFGEPCYCGDTFVLLSFQSLHLFGKEGVLHQTRTAATTTSKNPKGTRGWQCIDQINRHA
jgi:hypothetical protein